MLFVFISFYTGLNWFINKKYTEVFVMNNNTTDLENIFLSAYKAAEFMHIK